MHPDLILWCDRPEVHLVDLAAAAATTKSLRSGATGCASPCRPPEAEAPAPPPPPPPASVLLSLLTASSFVRCEVSLLRHPHLRIELCNTSYAQLLYI